MEPVSNIDDEFNLWDDQLAPLDQLQQDSFLELASVATNRLMPIEVPLNDPVNVAHKVSITSVPTPGSVDDVLSKGFTKLGFEKEKVETAQQFYSWFSKIEEEMEIIEGEKYTQQLNVLKNYQQFCGDVNKDLKLSLASLDKLENECISVTTKTNALHDACEQLLSDQTELVQLAENIEENLQFFIEYDSIQKYLSSANLIVTGDNFLSTLKKIDSCMDFMIAHPNYMESENYLEKYKTCLMIALGMIKNYTVRSLESTTQSIIHRKNDRVELEESGEENVPIAQEDAFTLYYGKFRSNAPKIKGLMEELEGRVSKSVDYQRYLQEIHASYFSQRELLLTPSVTTAMGDLLNQHQKDHCALVRSSCSFMLHVCEDEHQLFAHFFSVYSTQLHEMLVRLCAHLYDMLRPLIIHIYHLETLAELCMILKTEMIDDHVHNNSEQLQAFHQVAMQMLQDVQERLVYRANIYIRDEIKSYHPARGDLAYPQKLEMMEQIALKLKMEEHESRRMMNTESAVASLQNNFTEIKLDSDDDSANVSNTTNVDTSTTSRSDQYTSPADIHGMWYPTVRRVLLCLSKLYRCIDKRIFQGLSQEALQACVSSLQVASKLIIAGDPSKVTGKAHAGAAKTTVDGQLFLIKHLLILREQITPFQADFIIRETQLDFTKTRDAAYSFVSDPRASFPNLLQANQNNSIIKLMVDGTPQVKEFYVDSKKDVDRQLKEVCEDFIESQSSDFCESLTVFIDQAKKYIELRSDSSVGDCKLPSDLSQQQFAKSELVHELVSDIYRRLKIELKKTVKSLSLYLANKETEQILFKPIKLRIQKNFDEFHKLVASHYNEEEQQIIAAPTCEQIGLLITSTLKQG